MKSNELLKQKILDDAVHGKLVPHVEKKLTNELLKYEEKNSRFELPDTWKWINLDTLCELIFSAPSPKYSKEENENYCLGQKNNQAYGIDLNGMKYCSNEFIKSYKKEYYLKNGDVLLNSLGTGSVGRIGFFNYEDDKYITDGHLFVFRNNSKILPKYLYYVLKYFEPTFIEMAIGTTHQAFLKINQLKEFEIPYCIIEEQEKIVEKIEESFSLISQKEKNDEEKEKFKEILKEKILDEAIHGRLVENDLLLPAIKVEEIKGEIPFEIPNNWKWTEIKNIATIIAGTSFDKNDIKDEGIRIIRGGNIQNNKLQLRADDVFVPDYYEDSNKNLNKGDVIIVASTGSKEAIGKPAIINYDYNNTQIGAFLRIVRTTNIKFSKYVGFVFTSNYYRNYIREKVRGMAINNIKNEYILDMLIPLPPLEQQQLIVDKIENLFNLIDSFK